VLICKIKIIKPYWLALLKLQSYSGDTSREKDLIDFYFLIDHYFDCIDEEQRLYSEAAVDADLLSMPDFDTRIAGAMLIARDCLRSNASVTMSIQKNLAGFNRNNEITLALAHAARVKPEMAQRILAGIISCQASSSPARP
jgi:hypothetical protein